MTDGRLDVVVLGTAGHARSCLDAMDPARFAVRGCVGPPPVGSLQVDYLGSDDLLPELRQQGVGAAFVAVGDNALRQRLSTHVLALGFELATVIAPSAVVSRTATVGRGTVVMHRAVIGPYSRIGQGVIVNTSASVDHDCLLEDFVHVAPGSHLAGEVRLAEGCFLGTGTSVIPHISVGEWAIVGAGATVVRDLAPRITAVGTPAVSRKEHL